MAKTLLQQPLFTVIEFISEKSVEWIPTSWIFHERGNIFSYWPPKNLNIDKVRKKITLPCKTSWTVHPIRKLQSDVNYYEARKKVIQAEETSHLESEEELIPVPVHRSLRRRHSRIHLAINPTEDDSDSELFPESPSAPFRFPLPTGPLSAPESFDHLPGPSHESISQLYESQRGDNLRQLNIPSQTHQPATPTPSESANVLICNQLDVESITARLTNIEITLNEVKAVQASLLTHLVSIKQSVLDISLQTSEKCSFDDPLFQLPVTNPIELTQLTDWLQSDENTSKLVLLSSQSNVGCIVEVMNF
ncbi:unnamed protein product [Orchesella dallaii]|uniref:Uncharacterized protein n=1 Tax=Orchesella dallaii TaxID=48710 RepID=A0ABP1Q233_9HEXA